MTPTPSPRATLDRPEITPSRPSPNDIGVVRQTEPATTTPPAPLDPHTRPLVLLTTGRLMAFVVTFVTPLVLARIFDRTEFGTYKQVFLVYSTLAGIAQLGMAESLLYFLPLAPRSSGRSVLNALLVLVGSGLACLGFFAAGGPLLSRWLGNPALSGLSVLLGACLLFMLPSTVLEIVMIARKRYLGAGAAYALSDVLRATALVVPAILFRRLEWVLAGAVAFGAVRLGTTLLYLGREFGGTLKPDGAMLRKQLTYALPWQLGVGLWVLVLNLHYYVVASLVTVATFAIYAVGCFQIPIVDLVFTPAKNVMMVRMREAITANRPAAALAVWHDTTRGLALLFFPLAGLLVITAGELIPLLFTQRYAASVPIFTIWSTIILITPLQADGVLGVYADTRALAVLYTVQLLLIAGLVPPFTSAFGLVGAVLAYALTMVFGKSLVLVRAKRLMGVTLADLLPWRTLGGILGAAVAAALVALTVKARLAAAPLPVLVATSAAYAATYIGIAAARGLLDTQTIQATTGRIRLLVGWPAKVR